jgi:hypothetical protein
VIVHDDHIIGIHNHRRIADDRERAGSDGVVNAIGDFVESECISSM